MIAISLSAERLIVDGHAGYAKPGKDIVCSAVTVLTFNLINSIEALTDEIIEYQAEDPGHIIIDFKSLTDSGKLLVDSFFIGISEIIRAYPEYVQLK